MRQYQQVFQAIRPVFDGRSNMYTRTPLPIGRAKIEFPVDLSRDRQFQVSIEWVSEISLEFLQAALNGEIHRIPLNAVNAFDIVLRHLPSMQHVPVGRSFFSVPATKSYPLGGGREAWLGYYQSVKPSQWKMLLNIDVSSTAFYKAQSVISFLREVLDIRDQSELNRPLSDMERLKFMKEIKGLKIEITHCGPVRRKYRVYSLTRRSPLLQTFPYTLENGQTVENSVANYFLSRYNIHLQYPHLPCLQVGQDLKHTYLPLEVCNILKGQRCIRKLTDLQTSAMIKSTSRSAPEREKEIVNLVKKANFKDDPFLQEFGLKVNDSLMKIKGRVLDAPTLQYGDQSTNPLALPEKGVWDMIGKRFFTGIEIREWAIACFTLKRIVSEESLRAFTHTLMTISNNAGMPILKPPCFCNYVAGVNQVEPMFKHLKNTFPGIQLVVVILPGKTPIYAEVKRIGDTVIGIPTQCIQARSVNRQTSTQTQIISNVVLKINVKLGGINSILVPHIRAKIFKQPIIFLGVDIAHPPVGETTRPSIAAVVGSQDEHPSKYGASVRLQSHRVEIIQEFQAIVKEQLQMFFRSTGGCKPHRIILYRDGVCESKFLDVLSHELIAIRNACTSLEVNYKPGVTFIVVQKRHHTRLFFTPRNEKEVTRSGNVPPGTTVDHGITHPTEFDFYLCSHQGIQGTSRPSHYHVLWDENMFSADDLQNLTYQLCHTYARCTRSVSIPAPVFYAKLVAIRARHYLAETASDNKDEYSTENRSINVHDNVKNGMHFT